MLKKIIGFLNQDLLGQKSWRNSLFFGWRWILLVTILGLLFIPLLLIGIFFPLVVISIILIIILLFYKFKTKFSVKLTISLILGIASFIFNIILILNSNATIYLIFSFFTSLFSLIAFYVLIVLARFNFSQAYNNFIPDNQVIELNNILPLKPNLEIFSSNKAEIKSFNTNDNSNHKSIIFEEKKNIIKDIIEVGNLKPVLIPKRPQFLEIKPLHSQPNLKITNPDFSNIQNKLKDLPATGVFYINSLQLPYKRAILDREFFELETVKLYLELCNKTDDILRKKDFSLQKRIKESSQEYFDYDNTLYTLFCISEFSILNHYFPNKKDTNPNFSYDLLNKQLKFNISNLIQNFVNQKISNLPEIPQKLYYSLNRNKWREVLEKLLQVEYDLVKLKQKCDELLDLNSQNPSQYLIYLELCSQFAKRSKTASLWYYYKYYELLTFKNSPSLNLPEAKPLPVNIAKVIFEGDKEKLSQFEILCKTRSEFESPEQSLATTTRNPLNYSDEAKKEKIKNLFAIKRKVLKLDLSETKKAQQKHTEMTVKLNQVLQEEDLQEQVQSEGFQTKNQKDNQTPQITNLTEFFAGDTSSKSNFEINFTETESQLLDFFRENNFQLDDTQISNFAKSQRQFKNTLIQKINQKFYEAHEENLVEQNDQIYSISSYNQNLIQKH